MNLNSLKLGLKNYLEFIPFYLLGSGIAFTVDITIFTLLRTTFGTNYSAFISYIFGTITVFSILLITTKYRLNKKRFGLLIQLIIGFGTLLINLIILNSLDYLAQSYNYKLYIDILNQSHYYAFVTKVISNVIGFIWSSLMTGKFLFKKKK